METILGIVIMDDRLLKGDVSGNKTILFIIPEGWHKISIGRSNLGLCSCM